MGIIESTIRQLFEHGKSEAEQRQKLANLELDLMTKYARGDACLILGRIVTPEQVAVVKKAVLEYNFEPRKKI